MEVVFRLAEALGDGEEKLLRLSDKIIKYLPMFIYPKEMEKQQNLISYIYEKIKIFLNGPINLC
ncbi:MAG TPA: hypothetical protein VF839_06980 [Clostridium sp.]